ncbi:endonuclease [Virgibacillus indicus]|uniref:Endonuclease n=1 Tax=Virgibacillus indicus TaxID=2024554 RepID=A0A265N558_9BACI|nr:TIM barrel protein [Virgibacillus indicus]OZU86985.1 endonuclease [Virgibacillus indicus]
MKLAAMNITYRYYPFTYFLDSVERLGLDTIELWVGEPHLYVYRNLLPNIQSIRKDIKRRGIDVACVTPEQCVYPYNLAANDKEWRMKSIEYFKENIYVASELDSKMMLVTSGIGDFSIKREDSWNYALDSIMKLAMIAEREGIYLVLEPLTKFETNLVTNSIEMKNMIEEIGSFHVKAMADTVAMHNAKETPEQYFSLFKDDLYHFHLMDGDGISDEHLAVGDGTLPIPSYIKSLKTANYNGVCTLEIMGYKNYQNPESALIKSISYIEQCQKTREKE